jgi:peptide/nickel transport system substrate-binding protein
MDRSVVRALLCAVAMVAAGAAAAIELKEAPSLAERVAKGELPKLAQRLPDNPNVITAREPGRYGGELRTIMGRNQDTRLMTVYGYARLVAYTPDFKIVPDILEKFEIERDRVFTLTLRKGHRWSDGAPFTAEDFRYWWEDMANNAELYPFGPPPALLVDGKKARFEALDPQTVRISWDAPNPTFLARLAAPSPEYIFAPSHYLKTMHPKYADPAALAALVAASRRRNWAALHNALDNLYDNDNPALPTLEPWVNTTRSPSQRYVFVRNPYFHRVDQNGNQLPYIDRVAMAIADPSLIPAKTGAGDADLQARNLFMSHYVFLKEAEKREAFKTVLWKAGIGSAIALYFNLNHEEPVWRTLFRDVRFRRAMSLGIDRDEINQVLFLGLGTPANNTVLPESPLFKPQYQKAWIEFDLARANRLLDDIGLTKRNRDGIRLLPDGQALEIVAETAGEDTIQIDALELISDTWAKLGVKLFNRPSQREVFRDRIYAGETQLAVWTGLDNGLPTANYSPEELVPIQQIQLQWPMWGQYRETDGKAGEKVDMPEGQELLALFEAWRMASTLPDREAAWRRILEIHAEQQFMIGVVCCTGQPVVVANKLRGLPKDAIYSWDPGAYFGMYNMDTFWLEGGR